MKRSRSGFDPEGTRRIEGLVGAPWRETAFSSEGVFEIGSKHLSCNSNEGDTRGPGRCLHASTSVSFDRHPCSNPPPKHTASCGVNAERPVISSTHTYQGDTLHGSSPCDIISPLLNSGTTCCPSRCQ